jgi:hypothetical protein
MNQSTGCPGCDRRQELLKQTAVLADRYRLQVFLAEAYAHQLELQLQDSRPLAVVARAA